MIEIIPTTQFKRDLKRIQKNSQKRKKLETVVDFLRKIGTVPSKYFPHKLSGELFNK